MSRIRENTQCFKRGGLDDRPVGFKPSAPFTLLKVHAEFLISNHVLDTGVQRRQLGSGGSTVKPRLY